MIDLYMGLRRDHPQIRAGALRRAAGAYKIVLKRVDLINCDDVFELIAVPRRQLGDKTLDRLGGVAPTLGRP